MSQLQVKAYKASDKVKPWIVEITTKVWLSYRIYCYKKLLRPVLQRRFLSTLIRIQRTNASKHIAIKNCLI